MKVGSYMKIKIKNLLLIMFTLSIMLLNAGNVMADTELNRDGTEHALKGGQTYYISTADVPKKDSYYCDITNNPDNLLTKTSGNSKIIIKVKPFSGNRSTAEIKCTYSKNLFILTKDTKVTKTLTLIPNMFTESASIKTGETFNFDLSNVSKCSFSFTKDQKSLYSSDNSKKALLTHKDKKCSFSSNSDRKSVV